MILTYTEFNQRIKSKSRYINPNALSEIATFMFCIIFGTLKRFIGLIFPYFYLSRSSNECKQRKVLTALLLSFSWRIGIQNEPLEIKIIFKSWIMKNHCSILL